MSWPHGKDKRSLAALGMFSHHVGLCMAGHSLGHTPGRLASFPSVTLSPPYLNIPRGENGEGKEVAQETLREVRRTEKKNLRLVKPLTGVT